MKVDVYDTAKTKTGDVKLPSQFSEEYRPDLILRAVLAKQSHDRQPYAGSPLAGKRASAKLSRRRKDYRGSYGIGISRVPRKIMSRAGTRMNWVGAFMPGTVGGRRAHPPKSEKNWSQKINNTERKKAIRSAISATAVKEIVSQRGHILPEHYPFILDDKFESLDKTKTAFEAMVKLGLGAELTRVEDKKVRAGKGKMRGRKYKSKKGPLVVVSKKDKLMAAVSNIPGIDVVEVKALNAELLAPGGVAGRLTLWTKSALAEMEKQNLFR